MTIKDISEKYDIPYNIVYEATVGVKAEPGMKRDREYPVQPVLENVRKNVSQKIGKYERKLKRYYSVLEKATAE